MKFIQVILILVINLIKLSLTAIADLKIYPDPDSSGTTPDRNKFLYSITMIEGNSMIIHVK